MLSDLKNFFNSQKIEDQNSQEDLNTACAALLCEAASMDGSYDEKEKEVILSLIKKQFKLSESEALRIVNAGEELSRESSQIYGFTRTIKQSWTLENRIKILEMLWEVAYADGVLDPAEDMLIRRVAGLIHVEDRDRMQIKNEISKKIRGEN
jgi:uncharacterized tellurite resistance protein B-like protein